MNKKDLELILRKESLLEFNGDDGVKQYVDGEEVFYDDVFHRRINVFGIYKNTDGRYAAFITDAERGVPFSRAYKNTEEEACRWIYKMAKLCTLRNN